jgi:hypothetical protein
MANQSEEICKNFSLELPLIVEKCNDLIGSIAPEFIIDDITLT